MALSQQLVATVAPVARAAGEASEASAASAAEGNPGAKPRATDTMAVAAGVTPASVATISPASPASAAMRTRESAPRCIVYHVKSEYLRFWSGLGAASDSVSISIQGKKCKKVGHGDYVVIYSKGSTGCVKWIARVHKPGPCTDTCALHELVAPAGNLMSFEALKSAS
jgi:hypothetical protein